MSWLRPAIGGAIVGCCGTCSRPGDPERGRYRLDARSDRGGMMRRDARTVRAAMSLAVFRSAFPLGTAQTVVAVDNADRYAGIVVLAEAHAAPADLERLSEMPHRPDTVLLPQMTVKEAASTFQQAESDVLAVVDSQ